MQLKSTCASLVLVLACSLPVFAVETPVAPPPSDPVHKAVEAANKLYSAGKFDDAAKVYLDTLKATEKMVGPMAQLNRAILYSNLGTVYFAQKKFSDSEQCYKYALDIQKDLLKGHCAVVADTMQHYSALLRRTGKAAEADRWETQAEYLLVGNISGRGLVEPAARSAPNEAAQTTIASSAPKISAPAAATTSVLKVVQMTAGDKSILDNPLTVQKPVYRTEEYYEGGAPAIGNVAALTGGPIIPGYGFGMMVGGEKKTRQVLDHYESVPAEDAKGALSYTSSVADLERAYNLSNSSVKTICDAINSGGTAMELGNGWLLVVDENVDPNVWHSGTSVTTSKTPEGQWVLSTKDGKSALHATRVATK